MTHANSTLAARTARNRHAAPALCLAALTLAGLTLPPAARAQDASPAATAPAPAPATPATSTPATSGQKPPASGLTPATADGKPAVARLTHVSPLDRRMAVLTKELNLDSKQQSQIREILEAQRAAVRAIWSDPSILPPERTAATQAQAEHAGDAIRAVLNDEQQKRYNRARTDNALPPGDKRTVEQWMDAAKAKPAGNP